MKQNNADTIVNIYSGDTGLPTTGQRYSWATIKNGADVMLK